MTNWSDDITVRILSLPCDTHFAGTEWRWGFEDLKTIWQNLQSHQVCKWKVMLWIVPALFSLSAQQYCHTDQESFKAKEAIVLVAIEFRRKACKQRWQPDEEMKVNADAVRISLLKVAQSRAVKTFLYLLLKVPPLSKHPPPVCKIFTHTRQAKVILKQEQISGYTRLDFLWQCLFSVFTKGRTTARTLRCT